MGFAIDPACSGSQLIHEIVQEIPSLPVNSFSQRYDHLPPANRFYLDQLYSANLIDDNPVMAWMISCARISYGQNNLIYFEKEDYKNSPNRIDGIDTSVMSLASLKETLDLDLNTNILSKEDLIAFFNLSYH